MTHRRAGNSLFVVSPHVHWSLPGTRQTYLATASHQRDAASPRRKGTDTLRKWGMTLFVIQSQKPKHSSDFTSKKVAERMGVSS